MATLKAQLAEAISKNSLLQAAVHRERKQAAEAVAARDKALAIIKRIREELDGMQHKIDRADFDDLDALIKFVAEQEEREEEQRNLLEIESRRLTTAWRKIGELQAVLKRCGINH